jgi:hypothetical protein
MQLTYCSVPLVPYLTQDDRKTFRPESRPGEAAGKHVVAPTHARAHTHRGHTQTIR